MAQQNIAVRETNYFDNNLKIINIKIEWLFLMRY